MRRLKSIWPLLFVLMLAMPRLQAQQLAQYSQYLNNYYLINSAATDIQNNVKMHLGYRGQWSGFQNSPQTIYLSAYAPLNKPNDSQYMQSAMRLSDRVDSTALTNKFQTVGNHLIGTTITSDNLGLFNKTTFHVAYTYHLTLTRKLRLAASPKVGFVNLNLADDLRVLEDNDQPFESFVNEYDQIGMADLGFGLWLYSDDFFAGYSMEQLLKNKTSNIEAGDEYEFLPHHFFMLGFKYKIAPRWNLVPNALIRLVNGTPASIDMSVKAEYGSRLWGALSYRKGNAFVVMVGAKVSDRFSFGYSFDHSTNITQLNQINAHELTLQVNVFQNLHK
ncbi:PorP/SprF family type IX secretion system membrane protein [Roseivirga pacifica]|uniref:PorP/SprF family type IX secretion system membrane protein n=1 Tax=Roseivirga pacifica TaxID=1267423 RepID=UPI0021D43620|nr:type IX secretion system membrane protein PorP/SprF [Roseivirga pacifica]MCO6360498.1 type IX secretion system membrane protein PorP/SprF [Roseivirga pacifica]MCO6368387.1 type IX secretion system membrane protein PorP/SprF [Roseivirga pacifica]MCO6372529.1 type IX secretion system membrane protein PorP/SprF [Roseivirga pacifica]MCO6376587.1 type IX secretion system membrane protein PorP/SprF [Roseivirga pacifica]MCO6378133.1 type IX secretion system membrane protein PorP/SprF [Roseivirga p